MSNLSGKVMAMDDFDPSILSNEEALLFVCSTAGQGDEPSNMLQFWKFLLRRSLPANFLHGVYCAVLSLGDSSFPKFNWVGKRLSKRLSQLGSTEIIPIGLCDDQHDLGHAAVYVPWTRDLFKRLLDLFPLAAGEELQEERQFKWKVNVVQESADTDRLFEQISYITQLPVVENERTTTKDHFQDVRYIKLDATGLEWTPGDVACIRAQNSDEDVKTLFELFNEHQLNLHPDSVIQVKEYDSGKFKFIFNIKSFLTLRHHLAPIHSHPTRNASSSLCSYKAGKPIQCPPPQLHPVFPV